jgi:hypothetical protein
MAAAAKSSTAPGIHGDSTTISRLQWEYARSMEVMTYYSI